MLNEMLGPRTSAEKCGSKPALRVERPCPALGANGEAPPALPEEAWKTWSWRDYYEDARKAGKGYWDSCSFKGFHVLIDFSVLFGSSAPFSTLQPLPPPLLRRCAAPGFVKCGLQPFETVAVWGFNAPEWMLSTYAASMAAGKSAGLYPTDTPETAAFKAGRAGRTMSSRPSHARGTSGRRKCEGECEEAYLPFQSQTIPWPSTPRLVRKRPFNQVAHSGASLVVLEDEGKLKKLVAALTARPMARMKAGWKGRKDSWEAD